MQRGWANYRSRLKQTGYIHLNLYANDWRRLQAKPLHGGRHSQSGYYDDKTFLMLAELLIQHNLFCNVLSLSPDSGDTALKLLPSNARSCRLREIIAQIRSHLIAVPIFSSLQGLLEPEELGNS